MVDVLLGPPRLSRYRPSTQASINQFVGTDGLSWAMYSTIRKCDSERVSTGELKKNFGRLQHSLSRQCFKVTVTPLKSSVGVSFQLIHLCSLCFLIISDHIIRRSTGNLKIDWIIHTLYTHSIHTLELCNLDTLTFWQGFLVICLSYSITSHGGGKRLLLPWGLIPKLPFKA